MHDGWNLVVLVRRLFPRDRAAQPLYVTEQGATLGKRSGRLEIRRNRRARARIAKR